MNLIEMVFLDVVCLLVTVGVDALQFEAKLQPTPFFLGMVVWHDPDTVHGSHGSLFWPREREFNV